MIKKSLFLSACLFMVGGLSVRAEILPTPHAVRAAQMMKAAQENPDQSPMFRIEGAESLQAAMPGVLLAKSAAKSVAPQAQPAAATDSVSWSMPDTVYANKPNGQ